MMITFVCQCEKKALPRTRRVLDAFAERIGERTWQSTMTEEGLLAVKNLLRKTATKNTAVACHWIRSRSRSELLWIVGQRHAFNEQGIVPVNRTQKNLLSTDHTANWHSADLLTLLTRMAALFHDFGKANDFFINKLKKSQALADPFRHEWVSLRLFEAFVLYHMPSDVSPTDFAWLTALSDKNTDLTWLSQVVQNETSAPLATLPPLAQLVGWLVVTHHRLPIRSDFLLTNKMCNDFQGIVTDLNANWCYPNSRASVHDKTVCWTVQPQHLPMHSKTWQSEASRCASRLLPYAQLENRAEYAKNPLQDAYLSHVGRLALMLADHHYSSCGANEKQHDSAYSCYANTDKDGKPKQFLDDHLIGVNQGVRQLMGVLPRLQALFPAFEPDKHTQKQLETQHSADKYKWQDRAYRAAAKYQADSAECGFFGVNMASTGCGKTLANARIMYALADPERGARFNVAMGLRTLTLQTGQAYRQRLGLTQADLAILVGGGAVRELFEQQQQKSADAVSSEPELDPVYNPSLAESLGSESLADVIDKNDFIDFDDHINWADVLPSNHLLPQWLNKQPEVRKMLLAPLLCCTIDHLMPATESTRGGRQIAPMLRLMSSDLILDEPDDFSPEDWYALARLVYWAGLLGSRVLLSSATLTPAEVNGLFVAYQQGRTAYNQNRKPNAPKEIICAWFDENDAQVHKIATQVGDLNVPFEDKHQDFTVKREAFLAKQPQRRKMAFVGIGDHINATNWPKEVSQKLHQIAHIAHQKNLQTDSITQKNYSVGLVRFANIDTLAEIAQKLIALVPQADTRLHVCVYHSRFPLLVRANLEAQLDELLNRNGKAPHDMPMMRGWLNQHPEQHHIVVIMASPVAEVGRDHDYDWMIVEPSSMRSIIQVTGRVRRHRPEPYDQPNVFLMQSNIRHLKKPNEVAFSRPGFESSDFRLTNHFLPTLLSPDQQTRLDSTARIRPRKDFKYQNFEYLADLEHERMMQLMLGRSLDKTAVLPEHRLPVTRFWQSTMQHTGLMQQHTRFRKSGAEVLCCFKAKEQGDALKMHEFDRKTGGWGLSDSLLTPAIIKPHAQVNVWPCADLDEALAQQQARTPEKSWPYLGAKYLSMSLPKGNDGDSQKWQYHDWLGFIRAPRS